MQARWVDKWNSVRYNERCSEYSVIAVTRTCCIPIMVQREAPWLRVLSGVGYSTTSEYLLRTADGSFR